MLEKSAERAAEKIKATKTQQSQQEVEVMQQNAESDISAIQSDFGILGYTGTAADMSRRLRELEQQSEQFKK